MMRPTLVIFAKAPRLGRVKSRLARDIGASAALGFYRQMLRRVLGRIGRDRRWHTILAVTPDSSSRVARLWPARCSRQGQGVGDLGARMGRVLRMRRRGPIAIVGTDIPDLEAAHIATAFRRLGDADAVFGPAGDGGYWLVGWRRGPCPSRLFAHVRWSSDRALADTLANLRGRRVRLLDRLDDVDDGADWRRWRRAPASGPARRARRGTR
jgi:rSAM/selenodomain-associated transferase 1